MLKDQPEQYRKYYERAARAFPQGKHASKNSLEGLLARVFGPRPAGTFAARRTHSNPPAVRNGEQRHFTGWRAWKRRKNPALARLFYAVIVERFPNYYYAGRARERLRKVAAAREPADQIPDYLTKLPEARSLTEKQSPRVTALIGRGVTLHELGLTDLAVGELQTGDYRKADSHWIGLELARQYSERGQHHRALRSMKRYGFGYLRLPLDSVSREFWERLYPMPFAKQLRARAKPHRLDPYLLAGLIRQESEFNPSARSRAGALGLMQIMPGNWKRIGAQAGNPGFF